MNIARVLARLVVPLAIVATGNAAAAGALTFTLEASSADNLGQPHDIVLADDGRRLYVADNGKDRIVVLDATSLAELAVFGEGELSQPHDVVFDQQGRLLVADTGNSRIAIFTLEGSGARLSGELTGSIRRPEGVDIDRDGRVLATGAASGNIAVFVDGREIAAAGGFSSPHDVQVDARGAIWVADANNNRIVRLDANLTVVRVIGGEPYAFNGPRYLDFDAAGRMFVADKYANAIKVLAADGSLLQVLGTRQAGRGEGVFDRPEGVEIRGDQVWFSDTYNDRIVRYRMASP